MRKMLNAGLRFAERARKAVRIKIDDAKMRAMLSRRIIVRDRTKTYKIYYSAPKGRVFEVWRISQAIFSQSRAMNSKKILESIEAKARELGFKQIRIFLNPDFLRYFSRRNPDYKVLSAGPTNADFDFFGNKIGGKKPAIVQKKL